MENDPIVQPGDWIYQLKVGVSNPLSKEKLEFDYSYKLVGEVSLVKDKAVYLKVRGKGVTSLPLASINTMTGSVLQYKGFASSMTNAVRMISEIKFQMAGMRKQTV